MMNNLIRNLLFVGILLLIISSFNREEVIMSANSNKYVRYVMTENIHPREMYDGLRDWFGRVREIVWPRLDEYADSGSIPDSESGTASIGREPVSDQERVSFEDDRGQGGMVQADKPDRALENGDGRVQQIETAVPVMGEITGGFGWRIHPVTGDWSFHEGIDINAAKGTEIKAWRSGKVERVWTSQTYGLTLMLDHGDDLRSLYAHCSDVLVKPGDAVEAGEVVARVGDTGQTTGPHLHFGILEGGLARDPELYI